MAVSAILHLGWLETDMRLEHVLLSHCRNSPEKTALIGGSERISFGELGDIVQRIATGLRARGLESGARVIFYLPNSITFAESYFAVLAVGGVPIPVSTRLSLGELSYVCDDSDAAVIICNADVASGVRDTVVADRPNVTLYVANGDLDGALAFQDLLDTAPEPFPSLPLEQDEAVVIYTSGTTGRPKGAVLTHANLLIQHGFINPVEWGISGEDRYLVVAPMAHRAGMGRLVNAMMLGATIVIENQFESKKILDIIEREKITVFGMVPTMCRLMMPELEKAPHKAASLRMLTVTGEAFPVKLKARLLELMPDASMISFFGMTEAGGVTTLLHEEQFTHPDSVGRVSPGVEVRLVDDSGTDVELGEVGELWVRAGRPGAFTVMKEYLAQPEQTAQTLTDGWCHTGDLARFDEGGYLYVVDRKKDMILSGGLNIYSKEVELAIRGLPGVQDVAVIGLPDPVYGEAVAAIVEHKPDVTPPSADEVIAHCRANIASYKKPKHVFFRNALPRNASGKVRKIDLVTELTNT